jgi:hypothetical protein
VRRITKAALGGLAGCALALGATQAANGDSVLRQVFSDNVRDLDKTGTASPATTGAFDSAEAQLKVTEIPDGNTSFSIRVKNIDVKFADQTFVSHLHTGDCQENNAPGTEGHYQDKDPGLMYPKNEVWFQLTPDADGVAVDRTVVPFLPPQDDGVMSIVIHSNVTGAKEVCLPLNPWAP